MKSAGYISPFVPSEWIAAHGVRPVRVVPEAEDRGSPAAPEGLCPFAAAVRSFRETAGVDVLILATTCDQMRRLADVMDPGGPPVFLLDVPATWQRAASHRLYRSELVRLGVWLVEHGAVCPPAGRLVEAMEEAEAARMRGLAEARAGLRRSAGGGAGGVPLMLLGGPLTRLDERIVARVEAAGGAIVVDGTEQGERTWPRRFDRRRLRREPFEELADAYFGSIPDIFRRPNAPLFDWVRQAVRTHGIRGALTIAHRWCDLWRAEIPRLREAAGVPLLALDPGAPDAAGPSLATRIEAFLEVVR